MQWGLSCDYDVICEMDADLSHDAKDLPRIVAALRHAGLSIGSRYISGGSVYGWSWRRLWLSRGGNWYVRLWTGLPVRDVTAGFRAYHRRVLEEIDLSTIASEGYAFQIEMAVRTCRLGFPVVEVPITFRERREGSSKMSWVIVVEALWRTVVWGVMRSSPAQKRRAAYLSQKIK
jgi:dolichol-phosphate mannosyltransferase